MTTDIITATYPEDQRAVEAQIHAILAAAEAKDFEQLASYHLDGPKFTKFDDFEPLDRQDGSTARQCEEDGLAAAEGMQFRVKDLKVDVFGPVAVSTFVLDYEFDYEGDHIQTRARGTLVLVRDGADWKIAHEHFSAFKANP